MKAVVGQSIAAALLAATLMAPIIYAQDASLTAHFTAAASGLGVDFDGSGSTTPRGTITTYAWDFKDGVTGTGRQVTHLYANPGTYDVKLTITNSTGATATVTKAVTVLVAGMPTARFTVSTVAQTATFDGSTSSDPEGQALSYEWNLGDGTTASTPTVTRTYAAAGTYQVTLIVTDPDANQASITQSITLTRSNTAPTPSFSYTNTRFVVQANGGYSTDAEGDAISYAWTWGDGATGAGAAASHTYSQAGTYPVTLTTTDSLGAAASKTLMVGVAGNTAPMAAFSMRITGQTANFDASGSRDAESDPLEYTWDFGDGATGIGRTITHAYTGAGPYTVRLSVDDGQFTTQTSQSLQLNGANNPPMPSFTYALTALRAAFDASATTDADGDTLTYTWNFGDGATGSGQKPIHTYASSGQYTVTLQVADGRSPSRSANQVIDASTPNQAPVADFIVTVEGDRWIFVNASATRDPNNDAIAYAWTFGDNATATGKTASHRYATTGTYTVRLTASDNRGANHTVQQVLQITTVNQPPVPLFTSSTDGIHVKANATTSRDADGHIAGYLWSFGDGTTGSGKTVEHTYPGTGNYTLVLTVFDDDGTQASAQQVVRVTDPNRSPVPTVHVKQVGANVTLEATATDPDGDAVTFQWQIGNATNSTAKVQRMYPQGSHNYTLTATDAKGKFTIKTGTFTVGVKQPQADFDFIVSGFNVTLDASQSKDPEGNPLTYTWQLPGGQSATGSSLTRTFETGNHTVTLTARNPWGKTSTLSQAVTITKTNLLPVPVFTAQVASDGLTVAVDASNSTDPDGDALSFKWTFGDGGTATTATATHTYPGYGNNIITLTVSDALGASATATKSLLLQPPSDGEKTLGNSSISVSQASDSFLQQHGVALAIGGGSLALLGMASIGAVVLVRNRPFKMPAAPAPAPAPVGRWVQDAPVSRRGITLVVERFEE